MELWWNGEVIKYWYGRMELWCYGEMAKQFFLIDLWCVPISQRTDGAMMNEPFYFHLKFGSFEYYCVNGILEPFILHTT